MKHKFFTPTEMALKYRRNMLIFGCLAIVHFKFYAFSAFNVSFSPIPEHYYDIAIILVLLWFALNYFYYLYTEYTAWKADHIHPIDHSRGIDASIWNSYTLVPEIQALSNDQVTLRAELSSSKTYYDKNVFENKEVAREVAEVIEVIEEDIKEGFASDIKRIAAFQSAIKRYGLAYRFKFYILDLWFPLLLLLVSLGFFAFKYYDKFF